MHYGLLLGSPLWGTSRDILYDNSELGHWSMRQDTINYNLYHFYRAQGCDNCVLYHSYRIMVHDRSDTGYNYCALWCFTKKTQPVLTIWTSGFNN